MFSTSYPSAGIRQYKKSQTERLNYQRVFTFLIKLHSSGYPLERSRPGTRTFTAKFGLPLQRR